MRSKQTLLVIDEDILAFTRDEAITLFWRCGLTPEQANIALDRSRGRAGHFQVWPLHFITLKLPVLAKKTPEVRESSSLRMEGLKDKVSAPGVEQRNGMPGIRYANLRLPERRAQRHGMMATKTRQGKPPVASKTANDQPAELRPGFFLRTNYYYPARLLNYFQDHVLLTAC